jgi:nanoRNase/pAp phosphatase (c-di-AMP/oligoRNAs hydrolase)
VTAVVVCGERDGMIYLSGRSRDDRVHMGRALEAAVSDIPNASAGGHARMGGGQIPERDEVEVASGDASARRVSRSALIDRLFDTMSGDV